ncbi:MAG: hypothetical protein H8E35_09425 [Ardenticatenia bacterium]|nr:hypothetical protein [Ardenticatenia bacterium]
MPFDWTEFLTFAKALESDPNSPGPPEAALRSAASRAYYAAFHEALKFARSEGYDPMPTGDDHRRLREYFRDHQSNDKRRRRIATELGRCWDQRRRADYDVRLRKEPVSLAGHAIGMARSVLKELDSLREASL